MVKGVAKHGGRFRGGRAESQSHSPIPAGAAQGRPAYTTQLSAPIDPRRQTFGAPLPLKTIPSLDAFSARHSRVKTSHLDTFIVFYFEGRSIGTILLPYSPSKWPEGADIQQAEKTSKAECCTNTL